MKKFRVGFCYELGGSMIVEAGNKKEAEHIVKMTLDTEGIYEDRTKFETITRDYWTQDTEEVKGGASDIRAQDYE